MYSFTYFIYNHWMNSELFSVLAFYKFCLVSCVKCTGYCDSAGYLLPVIGFMSIEKVNFTFLILFLFVSFVYYCLKLCYLPVPVPYAAGRMSYRFDVELQRLYVPGFLWSFSSWTLQKLKNITLQIHYALIDKCA